LSEDWTVKKFFEDHTSQPPNPSIANAFYLAGFIESWGRGIKKICQSCESDGIPRPEYTINPNDIMIKFAAPVDRIIRRNLRTVSDTGEVTGEVAGEVAGEVTGEVTGEVAGEVTGEVTGEVAKLLQVMRGEMKRSEIQSALGLSGEDNFRKHYLKPALEAGLIEMTIPGKPNSRSQKYRLTPTGKRLK
jgi:predicted HTH transcriptional regulator